MELTKHVGEPAGTLNFREASLEDVPAICAVRLSVRENMLADPASVTPEMCANYLTEIGKGWVCEIEGEVVGFSIAALKDSSIWALFVRPGYEGRMIGRQLISIAVNWLFEMGAAQIVLSTDPHTRADRFYQAQGWTRGETRANGEVSFSLVRPAGNNG